MRYHAILRNPVVKRGTQPILRIDIVDDDGLPVDLTNARVYAIFKRYWTSTAAIIDEECEISDPSNGNCLLYLLLEDTSSWDLGRYIGEVELIIDSTTMDRTDDLILWVKPSIRD